MTISERDAAAHGACDARMVEAAIGRAFQFLGKRWNGVILASLGQCGPVGFSELKRHVGPITDSVLSDRLSELAATGLVLRSVADARPPAVSYTLTPAGERLMPVFAMLGDWAADNLPNNA